jgi:preprotein translocase subunit SecG
MKSLVIGIILTLIFVPIVFVFAQSGGTGGASGGTGGGTGPVTLPDPLGGKGFIDILEKVVNFLILLAIPITALMIIYGAYQIMFAGGDTEKVTTGKKTILYTVTAFVIILLAWSIIAILQNILGVSVGAP